MNMRVGLGFDVHAFAQGRKLILGGVDIPHHQGLLGHSDADVLAHAVEFSHIRVRGLMTMAPQGDLAVARECFDGLAALRDQLRTQLSAEQAAAFNELSMGMSEDWREAVCAGATMVRIGRALFSDSFESVQA